MKVAPAVEYISQQSDRLLPSSDVTGYSTSEMSVIDPTYTIPPGYSSGQWDNFTYYERYDIRLKIAYDVLLEWDRPQLVIPLEAPFYWAGGVDFLTPLAEHCNDAFGITGAVRLGFLGSKTADSTISFADIEALKVDTRLNNLGAAGKFVTAFLGETAFTFQESGVSYTGSPVHVIAGKLSTMPVNNSVTYAGITNAINLVGRDLKQTQIAELAELGINVVTRTTLGKRGRPFQVVSATDNTLATEGSDFWALGHTRMIMLVIERLRSIGRRYLGEIGYGQFKQEVESFFFGLVSSDVIRDFSLQIERSADKSTATVDVGIRPYFGVRNVYFIAEVGPEL
jgi:hypothetical protein